MFAVHLLTFEQKEASPVSLKNNTGTDNPGEAESEPVAKGIKRNRVQARLSRILDSPTPVPGTKYRARYSLAPPPKLPKTPRPPVAKTQGQGLAAAEGRDLLKGVESTNEALLKAIPTLERVEKFKSKPVPLKIFATKKTSFAKAKGTSSSHRTGVPEDRPAVNAVVLQGTSLPISPIDVNSVKVTANTDTGITLSSFAAVRCKEEAAALTETETQQSIAIPSENPYVQIASKAVVAKEVAVKNASLMPPPSVPGGSSVVSKAREPATAAVQDTSQQKDPAFLAEKAYVDFARASSTRKLAAQKSTSVPSPSFNFRDILTSTVAEGPDSSMINPQRGAAQQTVKGLQQRIVQLEKDRLYLNVALATSKVQYNSKSMACDQLLENLNEERKAHAQTRNNHEEALALKVSFEDRLKDITKEGSAKLEYDAIAASLMHAERAKVIKALQQREVWLKAERTKLQRDLNEAKMVAYETGKDLMQSEIGTLKRKITQLETANQSLSLQNKASMDVAVAAVKFAKAEIRFIFGDKFEAPYLDVSSGVVDLEKAFEGIQKARTTFEQHTASK